ncbi:hypothetical protein GQ53DRAFT_775530 [Thozetella sp. PMI_491]|nr:hypothetical protein GQ53DRAFT_775530 [Thozetella sp. PMI_491]
MRYSLHLDFLALTSLALINFAQSLPSSGLLPRDDQRIDEAVYLVECDLRGSGGSLDGTRDYWLYVADDVKFRSVGGTTPFDYVIAEDHQQHDGFTYHIDWTDGTAEYPLGTKFSATGHNFSVWGLKPYLTLQGSVDGSQFHALPGWRSIDAVAWLDSSDMECYGENFEISDHIIDYGECRARYVCYRKERAVVRTRVHIYDNSITVEKCGDRNPLPQPSDYPSLPNPVDAFANVKETIEKNQGGSVGYDVGGDSQIFFEFTTSNDVMDKFTDDKLAQQVSDLFRARIAEQVAKTQSQTEDDCINDIVLQGPLCSPCTRIKYPKEGYLTREVSTLASRDDNDGVWLPLSTVKFHVDHTPQCSEGGDLMKLINGVFTVAGAAAPFFEEYKTLGQIAGLIGAVSGRAPTC